MPKWAKVLVIVMAVGLVLLVAAGFPVAKILERGAAHLEESMEQASEDGTTFGNTGTLDGCVEEGVHRLAACEGMALICMPEMTSFLWGCLEAAPYDPAFCDEVPAAGDDAALQAWGRSTCATHGMPGDEFCAVGVAMVVGFCESQG